MENKRIRWRRNNQMARLKYRYSIKCKTCTRACDDLANVGGFILFLYGIVPTFQPSYFHRIYAAYGGIFIVMALLWGLIFEGVIPDIFDAIGATIACVGVAIIYYSPRRGEEKLWSNH